MNQPEFKSEVKATKGKKAKKEVLPTPKTPGGWAVLSLRGLLKEAHKCEPCRLPA